MRDEPRKSDLIDIGATKLRETEKGIQLDTGDKVPIWFPKSLVEDNGNGTFAMPEWLAKDKGII